MIQPVERAAAAAAARRDVCPAGSETAQPRHAAVVSRVRLACASRVCVAYGIRSRRHVMGARPHRRPWAGRRGVQSGRRGVHSRKTTVEALHVRASRGAERGVEASDASVPPANQRIAQLG